MSRLVVRPAGPLGGEVQIKGAKNSALKLMAACLLAEGRYVLRNVPRISDVDHMCGLLEALGVSTRWREDGALEIIRGPRVRTEAPPELARRIRASSALIGPLLASVGSASIPMPGGDDFGSRPLDMHLQGLEDIGASFEISDGVIRGRAPKLVGADVELDYPSVGTTENLLMAAALADGTTVIHNAAREPEISDLAAFLNRMGARIVGAGGPVVSVKGVAELRAVEHTVIPDRIEVATFLCALGVAGGEISLVGARLDHVELLVEKMGMMGLRISPEPGGLWAMASRRPLPVDVATLPYPGLATDYLPMLVALLCYADGTSFATENVFAGRSGYTAELVRMGARVQVEDHHMVIDGVSSLTGCEVRALDIRAGAALVVAALGAVGETTIHDADHLARGYEDFETRMRSLGADVVRVT